MAATWDPELINKEADIISTEARAKYYDGQINNKYNHFGGLPGLTFWSPNINIFRDPRWGRGQETYGEDPYLTSRIAISFIKGIQGSDPKYFKAIATPKHYAVHSGPEPIRHSFNAVTGNRDLHETYLPAFEASFREGGAWSVMGAYNAYNGDPCCASNLLLKDILRGEWSFKGYVVSDCSAITDIYNGHKITQDKALACAMAVKAGCDLTCGAEYVNLKPAVEKGYITEKEIDLSVSRLFLARMKLGMFDSASVVPYSSIQPTDYDKEDARSFTRVVAQKSIVLLKNDQLLPLSKKKLSMVAVIGPYINREDILLGNYHSVPSRSVNFLQGIINAVGREKVLSAEGVVPWDNRPDKRGHPYDIAYHSDTSLAYKKQLHDKAIAIAKQADVIIAYMGISSSLEGEEMPTVSTEGFEKGDRTTLDMPLEQQVLLKDLKATGKPIVLVLSSGSALAINWEKENIPSIVQAWYPGEEGGNAIADVLFGDYNPAGRLPITYYKSLADLPAFTNYNMENRTYRYFKNEPLFAFGYGLSYTKFQYSNLILSKAKIGQTDSIIVNLTVKNTGNYDGDEVVQLYVRNTTSTQPQPIKSLKGFKRVFIKKGESKMISIPLKASDVKYFNETKDDFIVEPGGYEIQVGASSKDIRLKSKLEIVGKESIASLKKISDQK
jgi:beta-glucosidase